MIAALFLVCPLLAFGAYTDFAKCALDRGTDENCTNCLHHKQCWEAYDNTWYCCPRVKKCLRQPDFNGGKPMGCDASAECNPRCSSMDGWDVQKGCEDQCENPNFPYKWVKCLDHDYDQEPPTTAEESAEVPDEEKASSSEEELTSKPMDDDMTYKPDITDKPDHTYGPEGTYKPEHTDEPQGMPEMIGPNDDGIPPFWPKEAVGEFWHLVACLEEVKECAGVGFTPDSPQPTDACMKELMACFAERIGKDPMTTFTGQALMQRYAAGGETPAANFGGWMVVAAVAVLALAVAGMTVRNRKAAYEPLLGGEAAVEA